MSNQKTNTNRRIFWTVHSHLVKCKMQDRCIKAQTFKISCYCLQENFPKHLKEWTCLLNNQQYCCKVRIKECYCSTYTYSMLSWWYLGCTILHFALFKVFFLHRDFMRHHNISFSLLACERIRVLQLLFHLAGETRPAKTSCSCRLSVLFVPSLPKPQMAVNSFSLSGWALCLLRSLHYLTHTLSLTLINQQNLPSKKLLLSLYGGERWKW